MTDRLLWVPPAGVSRKKYVLDQINQYDLTDLVVLVGRNVAADTPGAVFLLKVRQTIAWMVARTPNDPFDVLYSLLRSSGPRWAGSVDSATPGGLWDAYLDLSGWEEDIPADITDRRAQVTAALYSVADALVRGICQAVLYGDINDINDERNPRTGLPVPWWRATAIDPVSLKGTAAFHPDNYTPDFYRKET